MNSDLEEMRNQRDEPDARIEALEEAQTKEGATLLRDRRRRLRLADKAWWAMFELTHEGQPMNSDLEDLYKQRAELDARIEAMEEALPWLWMPDVGKPYWAIDADGEVEGCVWRGGHRDHHSCNLGLVAQTKEGATLLRDRLYDRVRRQRLADKAWADAGKTLDWGNPDQKKYLAYYRRKGASWNTDWDNTEFNAEAIYFPTRGSALASVEGMEKPL